MAWLAVMASRTARFQSLGPLGRFPGTQQPEIEPISLTLPLAYNSSTPGCCPCPPMPPKAAGSFYPEQPHKQAPLNHAYLSLGQASERKTPSVHRVGTKFVKQRALPFLLELVWVGPLITAFWGAWGGMCWPGLPHAALSRGCSRGSLVGSSLLSWVHICHIVVSCS